ncbi:putative rhamnogalacturonate lyase C [Hypsizygus marmoreus]|uniref:Rhamnogalacturonate lyase C n=1 Tax=Hypsizygus marmoreus TaxID=39966 RepID=A0A369J1U0_HYPMA|nr:putative rhamnogalacturonate lyase C [Hypsizygus marmoreus]
MSSGLDALLQSRLAADSYSPWRRRYTQSPSFPFFLLSSIYAFFRNISPPDDPTSNPFADPTKIRIVCISDTHNRILSPALVPAGDILVHAGDLTQGGTVDELRRTLDWLRSLPHPHKILIAGNHDTALADTDMRNTLNWTGLTYLCDESLELTVRDRTLRLFGSPWTPKHGSFAFQYPRDRAVDQWAVIPEIPEGIDVLVTHGPPKGHVDCDGLGCPALLQALWRVRPRMVVCGHIHGGRGVERVKWDVAQKGWEYVVGRSGRRVGWGDVAIIVGALVWAWIRGVVGRKDKDSEGPGESVFINCAVVGGVRDQLMRGAVVIDV